MLLYSTKNSAVAAGWNCLLSCELDQKKDLPKSTFNLQGPKPNVLTHTHTHTHTRAYVSCITTAWISDRPGEEQPPECPCAWCLCVCAHLNGKTSSENMVTVTRTHTNSLCYTCMYIKVYTHTHTDTHKHTHIHTHMYLGIQVCLLCLYRECTRKRVCRTCVWVCTILWMHILLYVCVHVCACVYLSLSLTLSLSLSRCMHILEASAQAWSERECCACVFNEALRYVYKEYAICAHAQNAHTHTHTHTRNRW